MDTRENVTWDKTMFYSAPKSISNTSCRLAALRARWNMLRWDVCLPLCNCLHWANFPKKHVAEAIEKVVHTNIVFSQIRAFINMRQPDFPFCRRQAYMRTLKLGPPNIMCMVIETSDISHLNIHFHCYEVFISIYQLTRVYNGFDWIRFVTAVAFELA